MVLYNQNKIIYLCVYYNQNKIIIYLCVYYSAGVQIWKISDEIMIWWLVEHNSCNKKKCKLVDKMGGVALATMLGLWNAMMVRHAQVW